METKICKVCQGKKPLGDFPGRYDGTGRLRNECRECDNASKRERYAETKGGRLEAKKTLRESDPKRCIKCGEIKPLDQFGVHNREKGQHRNMCRDCSSAWLKEYNKSPEGQKVRGDYREQNKEKMEVYQELYRNDPEKQKLAKEYHRKYDLMKQFGLTPDDYDEILNKQNGRCAVCKSDRFDSKRKTLAVDHDHVTGKVRGLFCRRCNQAIGAFEDNPDLLRKAATYLETI